MPVSGTLISPLRRWPSSRSRVSATAAPTLKWVRGHQHEISRPSPLYLLLRRPISSRERLNSLAPHAPVEPPRLPQPDATGGGRRPSRGGRLLPRLPVAVPRCPGRNPATLHDLAVAVGGRRRGGKGDDLCGLRALPEVVALCGRPRFPDDPPRGCRLERDPGRRLHRHQAV